MINFIDEKGVKHSAIVECKKTKGVNGEKSLSGTIYTNEKILEGIGRGWRLEFENEKYCLTYVYPIDEGNQIVVEFDAVHEFFFDLNKKVVYSELNGSNTAKAYLDLIFNGSGYSYLIEVNIPAFEKEGFGMRNRLDLFKEFISDTGVEFSVSGKVVRILEKVGSNLSTIVKKGFNLNELRIEKDPGSFITYKKGFGAWHDDDDHSKGRLEVEYLSPLASIYGKLEGDPIVDERYKVASNFETRLKNDVESSYGISVDIDMEDLTKAGYEYEQPHEGDYIMAINKDLGFEQKIRIMSYETSYDTNGNIIDHKVACGSDNIIRKSTKEDDDFRKEIQAGLEGAISTSNKAWVSANGKNAVFEEPDEPTATAIGDTWFQIDGDKKIMRIWNGYEWKPVFNPGEIENKIDQAEKDIAQNIIDIDVALDKASQAELDAGFSKDLAGEAKALGVTASSLAGEATTNANKAMTDAQEALTKANTAVTDSSKAFNKSFKSSAVDYATSTNGTTPPTTGWIATNPTPSPDVYIWTRTTIVLNDNTSVVSYSVGKIGAKGDQGLKGDTGAQGTPGANAPTITSVVQQFYLSTSKTTQTGGSWLATVPVWSSGKYYWVRVATTYSNGTSTPSTPVLDNALNDSLVTALEVKTANQNLSTTVTQHATLIEGKANSTTVDAIAGRVSTAEGSISTIAGQVALKANTTTVNTLTGRVTTAEGNITTQAGLIALKANQSVVDTLTGRVSTTESKITATDGKVTTLTTKTDGHTTQIGTLQSSYNGLSSTVTALETGKVGTVEFSALEQNLNGFKTTVANTYADKSTVTQLAGQWATTTELANGHTSQIASLGTDINLRATKTEVAESILADKKIKDTRNDNQLPAWYYTNYPYQKAYELKLSTVIGLPASAGTFASVTSEVPWANTSGGQVEQTATATDGVYQRRGTTTWSAWAKVADSSNIVSQINISPESILIASNKIQIKGDTYIDNGVIKTAHIDSLDASKITAGTLNAANVNIINLNANNIVSGTFSGINYKNPFSFWYAGKQFSGETTIGNGGVNQYGTASDGTQVSLTLTGGGLKTQYGIGSTNISPARIEFVAQNGTESLLHYSDSESVLYISSYVGGALGAYRKRNGVEEFRSLLKTETDWAGYNAVVIRGNLKANDINFPNGSFIYDNTSKDLFVSAPRHLYLRTNGVNVINLDPITSQIRTYLNIDMNYRNLWNVANITQTSDERLKTNITPTCKNGIEWTMKQRVVDYNWDVSNPVNRNKPTTKQFGIIAQNAGDFSIVNEQTGYLSVSSLDLINIGIKTDQEIIKKINVLDARLNTTDSNVIKLVANTSTYGTRLNNLESEVFRLKKRIEELEKIA